MFAGFAYNCCFLLSFEPKTLKIIKNEQNMNLHAQGDAQPHEPWVKKVT